MRNESREKIRGAVWFIPLLLVIVLLVIVARPYDHYDYTQERKSQPSDTATVTTTPTDSLHDDMRAFDPNEADYRTMIEAGVERHIAVSILKWREAGKVFRIKEDVALCYGMTDSMYFAIAPYINIGESYRIKPAKEKTAPPKRTRSIDSTLLHPFSLDTVGVPFLHAIGFSYRQAQLVTDYRDMIGGYRTMEEFAECYAVDSTMAALLKP